MEAVEAGDAELPGDDAESGEAQLTSDAADAEGSDGEAVVEGGADEIDATTAAEVEAEIVEDAVSPADDTAANENKS